MSGVKMLENCNAKITDQLLQVTTLFSGVHEDLLITSPLPAKWSAKQCLEHLNLTLHLYLPRIKSALEKAEPSHKTSFKKGVIGKLMINSLKKGNDQSSKQRSMKTLKQLEPRIIGNSSIEVVLEFSEAMNELYYCINTSRGKNIDKLRVTSAVGPLIKLRLGDVFPFLLEHNQRHINQAKRAIELCKKH